MLPNLVPVLKTTNTLVIVYTVSEDVLSFCKALRGLALSTIKIHIFILFLCWLCCCVMTENPTIEWKSLPRAKLIQIFFLAHCRDKPMRDLIDTHCHLPLHTQTQFSSSPSYLFNVSCCPWPLRTATESQGRKYLKQSFLLHVENHKSVVYGVDGKLGKGSNESRQ